MSIFRKDECNSQSLREKEINIALFKKKFLKILLLLFFPSIAQAQVRDEKELTIPWVRIYSSYVQDIFFDMNKVLGQHRIKATDVLIAVSTENLHAKPHEFPKISLLNYVTNRIEDKMGCVVHPNDKSQPKDLCGTLRLKAIARFPKENRNCELIENLFFTPRLFIDKELKYVRCLGKSIDQDRYFHDARTNEKFRREISTAPRQDERSDSRSDIVMGQSGYLGLDRNRLFGCLGYGVPVTYREKGVFSIGNINASPQFEDGFYLMLPTWQFQYLIKTAGFTYHCYGAKRLIDEVEEYGLTLEDESILLRGNVSVLRVLMRNGDTRAGNDLVKRVLPNVPRERLIDAIGVGLLTENPDVCNPSISEDCPLTNLGGWTRGMKKEVPKYFIQGIDKVMQSFFTN